jgi:molybdenum cofactor biosynthesis enzyme MoaA
MKNRDRDPPSFANINLFGKCNMNCFFCLGRDLPQVRDQDQLEEYFIRWPNFHTFLHACNGAGIRKIYITGQTADSLQYEHLLDLIDYLQEDWRFDVGLRTNGLLALPRLEAINMCREEIGYTMHSLDPDVHKKITGTEVIPDWEEIIPESGDNVRVSIVLNRHTRDLFPMLDFLALFPNVKYIQLRRVSTDHRENTLYKDQRRFDSVLHTFRTFGTHTRDFCGAPCFEWKGKEVVFWATVETTVNSYNYFTDGTWSKEYFVVEGYEKEHE